MAKWKRRPAARARSTLARSLGSGAARGGQHDQTGMASGFPPAPPGTNGLTRERMASV